MKDQNGNENKKKNFLEWFSDLPWYLYLIIALGTFFVVYTIVFYLFYFVF
mgnify:CR=1 FL=1